MDLKFCSSQMNLKFDVHNMFVSNEMEEFSDLANMPGSKCNVSYKPDHIELFDRVRREFVTRVDQQIMHQGGSNINSFRLQFLLGSEHKDIIDKWISCAIAKGAQHIELLFSHRPYDMPNIDPYIFPHTLFSQFKNHLHLQSCCIMINPEFVGFMHLKSLVLEELKVEKELLSCLFSKCFHLEDLTFKKCQFIRTTNIISSTLRNLKLIACQIISRMDVVTSNLSSLEFGGDTSMVISSINAPNLEEFYLNSYCCLKELEELEVPHSFALLASTCHLQNLSMVMHKPQVARLPAKIGPFQNIKEMKLFFQVHEENVNDDYLWVLNMVMACPCLQKLYFGILCSFFSTNQRQRREHPSFSHKELKYVELHGCVGHTSESELAIQFLKNTNSLEHIIFGPHTRVYIGAGEWFDDFERPHWSETGRNLVQQELLEYANGRTKLIFL